MRDHSTIKVILIEDDPALGEAVLQALDLEGFDVALFTNARAAIQQLTADFDGVIVSDIRLPGLDGIEFFDCVRQLDDEIPVIFTTGHGDVPMAVDLLKKGAADFFTKPYAVSEIVRAIETAAEKRDLVLENRRLRTALRNRKSFGISGTSQAAETLRKVLSTVADANIDAVLEGPRGTGKTYCARLLHDMGPRANRPFVTIGPGIAMHQDAEILLLGRDPGRGLSRTGLIERANGGTLFLDGISDVEGKIRSSLISVLESRMVLPLDAERPRKVDIRVIVATETRDRTSDTPSSPGIENSLGAIRIALPPLAARREDIGELFRCFITEMEEATGRQAGPIGASEWRHLQTHDWPGNLHELKAFARAFTLGLASPDAIEPKGPDDRSLQQIVAAFERSVLEEALQRSRGDVTSLSAQLQLPVKTLYDKLARHKLRPRDFK
ncbi:MAG: sigma-54-dependent Fis family transcriptional regulator [Alphaproteobacteria bacterium]|nr:MAG: sigma-54-dependent Fis family transcriptional regulator [Alphaproteobacteria bacterium]